MLGKDAGRGHHSASVFMITIEDRPGCKLHKQYNEWLTKYEEEQRELDRKRLEEQDLQQ